MDNKDQLSSTPQPADEQTSLHTRQSKKAWVSKVLLTIVAIVLAGAIGYVGYIYGVNSAEAESSASNNTEKTSSDSEQTATAADSSFHTVKYGSLGWEPKFVTNMAFPQSYQAIAYDNTRESFKSLFGSDSGDHSYYGGEWKLGNPDDGTGGWWGTIGIMGIADDWYERDGFASYGGFNADSYASEPENTTINGYDFSNPQQKKASLKKLANDTSACAKDSAKGFSISGTMNVCYKPTLFRQAVGSYDPMLKLDGYTSINEVPYVMFGTVKLKGGLDGYDLDALNKAGDDFLAGNIPDPTQKNIDEFIEAMKNSSIATE